MPKNNRFKEHRPSNGLCSLRVCIYNAAPFLFLIGLYFLSINFHTVFMDATTTPPSSVAFGPYTETEQPPPHAHGDRMMSGYYTADPTGTTALFPYQKFSDESILGSSIPFWNPFTLIGQPFLAEYQWGVFYPLSYLSDLPGSKWLDYRSTIHVLISSIFVFFLSLSIMRAFLPAVFSSVSVLGCGYVLTYYPTYTIIQEIPWGIASILGIEMISMNRRNIYGFIVLILGVWGLGTAGHPSVAIFWSIGIFIYYTIRIISDTSVAISLPYIIFSGLIGASLSSTNLLPFVEYIINSQNGALSQFSEPNNYPFLDSILFFFPYLFGQINDDSFTKLIKHTVNPGFYSLPPMVLFAAFFGVLAGIRHRVSPIIAMAGSAICMGLWGFGAFPMSILSSIPLFVRLNINYMWIIPDIFICVISGYGSYHAARISVKNMWIITGLFTGLYLLIAAAFFINLLMTNLWNVFWQTGDIAMRGLVPGLCFGVGGPLIFALVVTFAGYWSGDEARARTTSTVLFLGLGLGAVAYYPSANPFGPAIVPIYAFAVFAGSAVLFSLMIATGFKFLSTAGLQLAVVAAIGLFSATANKNYLGLPPRVQDNTEPEFISLLQQDKANWRSYGVYGAIGLNNLVPYGISALNNQNALVPLPSRNFIENDLDSVQPATQFYGLPLSAQPGTDPLEQFASHRRYWDYLGVRYVLIPSVDVPSALIAPNDVVGLSQTKFHLIGYEPPSTEPSSIIAIPQLSQDDPSPGLVRKFACSDGTFEAIRVRLGGFGNINPGHLVATAFDDNHNVLARGEIDASKVDSAVFHTISLGKPVCNDRSSSLTIDLRHSGGQPERIIAAWQSQEHVIGIYRLFDPERLSQSAGLKILNLDTRIGINLFENPNARPRAYFTPRFALALNWQDSQAKFAAQTDLRNIAFGEDPQVACPDSGDTTGAKGESPLDAPVKIEKMKSSSVKLSVNAPGPGTVVLTDGYAEGWRAKIDGRVVPVIRINGAFRGLCLPAGGQHEIVMWYRPPLWDVAVGLPMLGFAGIGVLIIAARREARKRLGPLS